MSVNINKVAVTSTRKLIEAGNVDLASDWSISASDENKLLGDNDWSSYSRFFIGVDTSKPEDIKAHYKYPIGKNGKVYRSAIIAVRQRSGQQKEDDIFEASGKLLALMVKKRINDLAHNSSRTRLQQEELLRLERELEDI